jgi:hypothetical protein
MLSGISSRLHSCASAATFMHCHEPRFGGPMFLAAFPPLVSFSALRRHTVRILILYSAAPHNEVIRVKI